MTSESPPDIWKGQLLHFVCLACLLVFVYATWRHQGEPFPVAFWIAIACPIVHQVFVWLAWRFELQSGVTTRIMGFRGYVICFFLLFGSRFVSLLVLSWLDRESLGLDTLPRTAITALLVVPGMYAAYSVKVYFGMARAAGADHFDSEFRTRPLVREGIFRFTDNAMYAVAFLLFWAVAVAFNSTAALTVAGFSHVYIWVHYYSTERPDMVFLYAPNES